MHTILVEIYSENATSGIFYKPDLTQAWNTVHQSKIDVGKAVNVILFCGG